MLTLALADRSKAIARHMTMQNRFELVVDDLQLALRCFQTRCKQTLLLQVLRDKLLAEAEESVRLNADVAARWAHLFKVEVPQELQEQMQSQQAACDEIIASKDAIVADMRTQLHQKDDEYVRMLKQQGEDVDKLLASMQQQLEELQQAYRDELEQIDEAYMQVQCCYST